MPRPAGVPNKITSELREMIECALHKAGGRDYLVQQAKDNPAAFLSLVGKLIPRDLNVSGEVLHTLESMILGTVIKKSEDERPTASH